MYLLLFFNNPEIRFYNMFHGIHINVNVLCKNWFKSAIKSTF